MSMCQCVACAASVPGPKIAVNPIFGVHVFATEIISPLAMSNAAMSTANPTAPPA
jgi:hypothetical protein